MKVFSFALVAIGFGSAVMADPSTYTVKDWQLVDNSSVQNPNAACVASTSVKQDRTFYKLEIVHAKNAKTPTEVYVHQQSGAKSSVSGWQVVVEGTGFSEPFVLQSSDAATGAEFFWGVPTDTHQLIEALTHGQSVAAFGVGVSKKHKKVKLHFSNDGAAEVLAALQQNCGAGSVIDNADFEQQLLSGSVHSSDVASYDVTKVASLRDLYQKAATSFSALRQNALAQADLKSIWAPQLDERESLMGLVAHASQSELPGLKKTYDENESHRSDTQSALDAVVQQLPKLEEESRRANEVLTIAQTNMAPYVDPHASLVAAKADAQARLTQLQDRKAQSDSDVAAATTQLASLKKDLSKYTLISGDITARLGLKKTELSQAQKAYMSYDERARAVAILQANAHYQALLKESRALSQDIERLRSVVEKTKRDADHSAQMLNQCRAAAGAVCNTQQAQAERVAQQAQAAQLLMEKQSAQAQSDVAEIEKTRDDASTQAATEHTQSRDHVKGVAQQVAALQASYQQVANQIRQMSDIDIPNVQNTLSSAQIASAGLTASVAKSNAEVNQKSAALRDFESNIGWEQRKLSVERAQSVADLKSQQLANAREQKSALETEVARSLDLKRRLDQTISSKSDLVTRSLARITALTQDLLPYENARFELTSAESSLRTEFATIKARYDAQLPH